MSLQPVRSRRQGLRRLGAATSNGYWQGGITCGTIDEPRKSSKVIDERVIIDFRNKNVVIARFRDKNGGLSFLYIYMFY